MRFQVLTAVWWRAVTVLVCQAGKLDGWLPTLRRIALHSYSRAKESKRCRFHGILTWNKIEFHAHRQTGAISILAVYGYDNLHFLCLSKPPLVEGSVMMISFSSTMLINVFTDSHPTMCDIGLFSRSTSAQLLLSLAFRVSSTYSYSHVVALNVSVQNVGK